MRSNGRIESIITDFYEAVLNFLFPQFCISCGKYGSLYCEECIKERPQYGKQRCFVCGKFAKSGKTHTKCKKQYSPDQLIVISKYENIEKRLIYKLKYQNGRNCAKTIAQLIARDFPLRDLQNKILCPIPLHKKRLRNRGYNQVDLIADNLAKQLEIKKSNLLIRIRNTKPQHKLNKKQRIKNLKSAFDINPMISAPKNVLLLDDLTTSGSTFKEATAVLKRNGVQDVVCLAFARGR